jgi:hypothetical protein
VTQQGTTGSVVDEMTSDPATPAPKHQHLELPVEELLRRVKPMPPLEDLVIEDLTPEEGEAFLEAVRS